MKNYERMTFGFGFNFSLVLSRALNNSYKNEKNKSLPAPGARDEEGRARLRAGAREDVGRPPHLRPRTRGGETTQYTLWPDRGKSELPQPR